MNGGAEERRKGRKKIGPGSRRRWRFACRRGSAEARRAERIRIYRRDKGRCQQCLAEGKPPKEAKVPWEEYEADHIVPHSKGGETVPDNAQVLCRYHNRQKGAQITSPSDPPPSSAAEPPPDYRPGTAKSVGHAGWGSSQTRFWLSPVGTRGDLSPLDVVRRAVGCERFGLSRDARGTGWHSTPVEKVSSPKPQWPSDHSILTIRKKRLAFQMLRDFLLSFRWRR